MPPLQRRHDPKTHDFSVVNMPSGAMDTSYLSTQVSSIIGQLHGLFDEIGVPSHERDSREAEVG